MVLFGRFVLTAAFVTIAVSAQAAPITFSQVNATSNKDNFTFVNNGNGTGLFNTATASGDHVLVSIENLAGLPAFLQGPIAAIETINGGAGVTTTAAALSLSGFDFQPLNASMVLDFSLATPVTVDGTAVSHLLTVTITPPAGSNGPSLAGIDGGSGATLQATNAASVSYGETFKSDLLSFQPGSQLDTSLSFSAVNPILSIAADGLINSFTADGTGTFSADPVPTLIPEPPTWTLLAGSLGLMALMRRKVLRGNVLRRSGRAPGLAILAA